MFWPASGLGLPPMGVTSPPGAETAARLPTGTDSPGPLSWTTLRELALLQSTLFSLQHQQLLQLGLIQQLQSQLQLPAHDSDSESIAEDGASVSESDSVARPANTESGAGDQKLEDAKRDPPGSDRSQTNIAHIKPECPSPTGQQLSLENELSVTANRAQSPPVSEAAQCREASSGDPAPAGLSDSTVTPAEPGREAPLSSLALLQRSTQQVLDSATRTLGGSLADALSAADGPAGRRDPQPSSARHRCRYCGKAFGSDSALQIHIRSHTGERPFKCNICGNRFTTKGNLKVHFQRHVARFPHVPMSTELVPEHLDALHPPLLTRLGQLTPPPELGQPPPPELGPPPLYASTLHEPSKQPLPSVSESYRAATTVQRGKITENPPPLAEQLLRLETLCRLLQPPQKPPPQHQEKDHGPRKRRDREPTALRERPEERGTAVPRTECRPNALEDEGGMDTAKIKRVRTPCNEKSGITLTDLAIKNEPQEETPVEPSEYFRARSMMDRHRVSECRAELVRPGYGWAPASAAVTRCGGGSSLAVPNSDPSGSGWEALRPSPVASGGGSQCSVCGRVLSCRSALQMHYRTHTGERPYRCRVCGRAFTTKGNLKTHVGVHRGRAPLLPRIAPSQVVMRSTDVTVPSSSDRRANTSGMVSTGRPAVLDLTRSVATSLPHGEVTGRCSTCGCTERHGAEDCRTDDRIRH
ncbi:Homeotic protein spalt-major [Amphibalanus amphitrite]|uniref:Homeotic protein spalt-major n=1 Tax=Amphibalanus amphitrite TaxID=1232801 RepID=A0A6A4VAC8_AMPAM|nr:Homeotic protein spalt-major [Amphibalanus amphitrite]